MDQETILSVQDLRVSFRAYGGTVQALRGISLELKKGETLAIVGESGSGKSVTSKAIMGILPMNASIDEGSIMYDGMDLTRVDESRMHEIRGKRIGLVFQDPLSSLNPIMKVGYKLTQGRKIPKVPKDADIITWKRFMENGKDFSAPLAELTQLRAQRKTEHAGEKKEKADKKAEAAGTSTAPAETPANA